MKYFFLIFFIFFGMGMTFSQVTLSGKVLEKNTNVPIIGANIVEKGTSNGTVSDVNGSFSIQVAEGAIVEISFLGYTKQEISNFGTESITILLEEDRYQLDNVIVTAFGIEKEKKSAGFSFSEINGEDLTEAREVNVASQLAGKVAGLEITKPSNGPSGATRIVIRGLSQFQGENRPLIVIDGIPADNSNVNTAGLYGGRDSGDGLTGINPDDIESVTVLKGPSAAALYGSRAGNGVLLITTKKGRKRKGIGVEYSLNYTTEEVSLLPNYQDQYGQGANGEKPTTQQEAFDNWRSWGALLDGSPTPIFNGETLPYSAVGQDDIRDYYQRGNTLTQSISLTGGNEKIGSRLSFSKLSNTSIVPEAKYDRYTINLNTQANLTEKISLSGKMNYIQEDAVNRVNLTDNPSNPSKYFVIGPANLPHSVFKRTRDEQNNPIYWSNNPFTLSPYWGPLENQNSDTKTRVLGFVGAKWEIIDNLFIQGRMATDESTQDFLAVEIDGTQFIMPGAIFIDQYKLKERNYDLTASYAKKIHPRIGLDVTAGATRTDRSNQLFRTSGTQFINPGFISINNMAVRNPGEFNLTKSRINALFATTSVSINDYLYIEGSVRNDFFSVLTNPQNVEGSENSILYGSGSLSFILSDAIKLPDWVGFSKFRVGYGTSGFGQISPYSQVPVFAVSGVPKELPSGNAVLGNIKGDSFSNPFLQPSRTKSFEIGTDWKIFYNRIGLEFTYYNQRTDKHIFPSPLPSSTGYNQFLINAGEVQNQGVEFLLTTKLIQKKNFSWSMNFNFSKNANTVVSLAEGIDQLNLGVDRTFSANIVAQKGGQIGDIWGNVYERNENGYIVHGDDGLPQIAEEREILGNFNPDWYGGLTSTIQFKKLKFSFLIDTKQGGEILSTTSSFGYLFGRHINSLEGRDNPDFMLIGEGVGPDGVSPNTTPARVDDYYETLSSVTALNVYDASYVKLRQASLSYTFDGDIVHKIKFLNRATISLTGRNLFFFTNGLDEIGLDPESIYTATADDVGIEYAALPSTRSFGVNLNIKF